MTRRIEEKELVIVSICLSTDDSFTYLGDDESLDQHNNTASHHGSESDDVQSAKDVKNNVARTSQVFS